MSATAASLWPRNRQPRLWRDDHELDVADAGKSLDDMTEDQLIERVMLRRAVAQRKPS